MSTILHVVGTLMTVFGVLAMLLAFFQVMPTIELSYAFGGLVSGLLLVSVGIALKHLETIATYCASKQKTEHYTEEL